MASKAESLFTKITNEVLDTAERVINVVEEGVNVLMAGDLSESAGKDVPPTGPGAEEEVFMSKEEDMLMGGSPLEGIAEGVIGDLMRSQSGPQTPMEHVAAFRSAINWSETFLLSILAFQIIMFLCTIWASRPCRGTVPRIGFLVTVGILVRCAERFNSLGAEHWESFATQNYFDKNGIFIGILFCGPLLLYCFMLLFIYLREAAQLLVQVKRAEIGKKQKATAGKPNKKAGNNKKKAQTKQD